MIANLLLLLLLNVVVRDTAGKYVYIRKTLNWIEAQMYCRTHHTDLAPINSEQDTRLIQKLNPNIDTYSWIGLMNSANSSSGWLWSGGGEVSTFFWAQGEPNDYGGKEDNGAILNGNNYFWFDAVGSRLLAFICYKVHAIREKMTWDEALQYCRGYHDDLASVASMTEMMLIEKELRKELSSRDVWIGLQFLDANWQWMDRQPFTFESWGTLEKPICPDITFACGALRVQGPGQETGLNTLTKVSRVEGWNALDCNRKLHFLCY